MSKPRTPIPPFDWMSAPTSSGRVLLARALTHYCLLHWGIDETEIPDALAGSGDPHDVASVGNAATLLGRVFADGGARTFARPFGGGPAVPLEPQHWEVDDHRPRFAVSAMNLRQPWDTAAEPTHWVFVDAADWVAIVEASCADVATQRGRRPRAREAPERNGDPAPSSSIDPQPDRDILKLVRMPEVRARTGLARSTIYKKVGNGTFPEPVSTGSFLAWRETAVDDWLATPR